MVWHYIEFMRPRLYYRPEIKQIYPEMIGRLAFLDCLKLIRELQNGRSRDLKTRENIKIIKHLEKRIKYLGRTESYICMAALPAVNALVS
jgi:hypothetical protein